MFTSQPGVEADAGVDNDDYDVNDDDDKPKGIEDSLFKGTIDLLKHMHGNMLDEITLYVYDDVKARSRAYRRDKWVLLACLLI